LVHASPLFSQPPPLLHHTQYADGEGYGGSVQGQRLHDDAERLQEERHKQELKDRRKVDLDLQWTWL